MDAWVTAHSKVTDSSSRGEVGAGFMRNMEGKRVPVDLTWTSTRTHKRNGGHTASTEQGS